MCYPGYCVCYIHEEFNWLLRVLKNDSIVAHENCDCTSPFCASGNCRCVFTSDMDLYWFIRHLLCTPTRLHSQTSRNLFPPRYRSYPFLFLFSLYSNVPFSFLVHDHFSCLEECCSQEYLVYDFKDSYLSVFEEYKKQELLSLAIMKSELFLQCLHKV